VPTYQYSCTECGHFFEQVQSFTEDSLTVCPECQGRLRKVFNAVGVVFKGSGFYRTDSRSGGSSSDPATTGSSTTTEKTEKTEKSSTPATAEKTSSPSSGSGTSGGSTAGAGVG
jgi:putative FmdB family regulatory protein